MVLQNFSLADISTRSMVVSANEVPSVYFSAVSRSYANEADDLHPTILSFSTGFTPRVAETLSHNV